MQRTDIHRPSAINPSEYQYVGCEVVQGANNGDLSALFFMAEERKRITDHMAKTGGNYSRHDHGGNCMVCGSVNAIYTILFYHSPTNSYVRMGQDCAAKCEVGYDDKGVNVFRTSCKEALELIAGKRKAEAILTNAGLTEAWALYLNENAPREYEENTIINIVMGLIKYGSISQAQEDFVKKLLAEIPLREEKMKKRAEEKEKALPVPVGKIVIKGEILKIANYETMYGITAKMTVKNEAGWIVFGTVPSKINCQRGDKIEFLATVEASKNDEKFGFFKRPTKAVIV